MGTGKRGQPPPKLLDFKAAIATAQFNMPPYSHKHLHFYTLDQKTRSGEMQPAVLADGSISAATRPCLFAVFTLDVAQCEAVGTL